MMDRQIGLGCWPPVFALASIVALACGCGSNQTLREVVQQAAELEKSCAADHAQLRSALTRIEKEGGFPLSIGQTLPPSEANLATALCSVIDPMLRTGCLERTNELFPSGRFEYTPLQLAEARQYLQKHRDRLVRFHAALRREECAFPIDYRLGHFYEPTFVDDVTIACRFLAFEVADALARNDVAAALEPLKGLWRLSGDLGRARLLTARMRAAELRAEALLVMEAVANHPHAQAADLHELFDVVQGQLAQWPPDEACLIGDRALALHSYECIRLGLLHWILTTEEKERFHDDLNLDSLPSVVEKTIDDDQWFYLDAMRRHIELCRQEYFLRKADLVRLDEELNVARMSQDRAKYPILAATLFLPELDGAHEAMARDRARCEAFALGLAEAGGGQRRPDYAVNPHHGRAYRVVRQSQRVVVEIDEADERDVVIAIPSS